MQDDRDEPVDNQGAVEDPDAPPRSDELRAARSLRDALRATEEASDHDPLRPQGKRTPEARWLAAHLRFPTEMESLGELRARGLARAAKEQVTAKRSQAQQRSSTLRQLGRSVTGTGGLLLAAAMLLLFSWAILDQGSQLRSKQTTGALGQTAWLLRDSLRKGETPTARLDMLLQERLHQRRSQGLRTGITLVNRHHRIQSTMAIVGTASDR